MPGLPGLDLRVFELEAQFWEVLASILGLRKIPTGNTVVAVTSADSAIRARKSPSVFKRQTAKGACGKEDSIVTSMKCLYNSIEWY